MATRAAIKESIYRCAETCPKVNDAIEEAIRQVLVRADWIQSESIDTAAYALTSAAFEAARDNGTLKLRDALDDCEDERLDLMRTNSDLTDEIAGLKKRVNELEDEKDELSKELRESRQLYEANHG